MKRNYSDIYNSLSSSPHHRSKSRQDSYTISSLSSPFWSSSYDLLLTEPLPPLVVSQSAPHFGTLSGSSAFWPPAVSGTGVLGFCSSVKEDEDPFRSETTLRRTIDFPFSPKTCLYRRWSTLLPFFSPLRAVGSEPKPEKLSSSDYHLSRRLHCLEVPPRTRHRFFSW